MFLGEDLMETGRAVQVKAMRDECLPCCKDSNIGRIILGETNPIKDVLADGDMGHASKLMSSELMKRVTAINKIKNY